jgi:carbamoyl-phosphate synthase small subunit
MTTTPAKVAKRRGYLALEDGRIFQGWSCGAEREVAGEVVFNTSMTGYQEILTDPSYKGQIVAMTYPQIGNYGVNPADVESRGPQVEGFVVHELWRMPSNWRSATSLDEYLIKHGIPALEGIDTRALTKHIRTAGAMRAVLSCLGGGPDGLVEKAREWPGLVGQDMVRWVTCKEPYNWPETEELSPFWHRRVGAPLRSPGEHFRVVAMDFGIKYNILRILQTYGCSVTVVPATATAPEILSGKPDGVFLSNGPGDPAAVTYAVDTVRGLLGRVPVFGICLGHQLMGLAAGGKTFKLKFGHRGANQPVKDLLTGRVYITSQNHGFCVDPSTLKPGEVRLSHVNLNDRTLEGLELPGLRSFSVQHHPEASPGPHDHMRDLFEKFVRTMRGEKTC